MRFDLRNKEELKQIKDTLANEPSCTKEQVKKIYRNLVERASYLYGVEVSATFTWHTATSKTRCYGYYHNPTRSIHLIEDFLLCNGETFAEEICAHEIAHAVQHAREGRTNHAKQFIAIWEELMCREARREVINYARVPKFYRYKVVCPNCEAVTVYRGNE